MVVSGKTVCGSTGWNVLPPSVDHAADQLAVAHITPSAVVAPLGSAHTARGSPQLVSPADAKGAIPRLVATTIGGGAPRGVAGARVREGVDGLTSGIALTTVGVAVGTPATNGARGTVQPDPLTSSSMSGGPGGNPPPITRFEGTETWWSGAEPGAAGGIVKSAVRAKQ